MKNLFDLSYPTVAVAGGQHRYPVRRIYCVGRNYASHVREMGHDPDRDLPFFFMKPADAIVESGGSATYPPQTTNLHHEIELVAAIGKAGADIGVDEANEHIWGYGVGIDLTRRDLQEEAKTQGRPWDTGKGFDESAAISALHPATAIGHPTMGRIWLKVNDKTRQDADIDQLIWSVPEVISYLSKFFTLEPGDLVYTGTPGGVGPVHVRDRLMGGVDGVDTVIIDID